MNQDLTPSSASSDPVVRRRPTREQLRREAFRYIKTYYNVVRRHSALGYISPAAFEAQKVA